MPHPAAPRLTVAGATAFRAASERARVSSTALGANANNTYSYVATQVKVKDS